MSEQQGTSDGTLVVAAGQSASTLTTVTNPLVLRAIGDLAKLPTISDAQAVRVAESMAFTKQMRLLKLKLRVRQAAMLSDEEPTILETTRDEGTP